ncbi:putative exo-beta-1,3-glucanase [Xylogone sp. PMI_703]|nr:putative exo-beta-1,3-glucanase [Xylogone sp. PMI_703]
MKVSLFLGLLSSGSALALPALNAEGIPSSLPANETALYPPYTFVAPPSPPKKVGIPLDFPNKTIKPWDAIKPPRSKALVKDQSCSALTPTNPSTFWYEQITHNGMSPFIQNGASWQVYRNVKTSQFGAAGNGVADDTNALQNAINLGNSNADRSQNRLGTTGQPAVVYLPSGTYMISRPLQLYVDTVFMGNPINPPVIKATSNFAGSTMLFSKDPNHDSTINFYIAVKNLVLDSTNLSPSTQINLMDWSVSQATQLTNVVFNMPTFSTGHKGIVMPEGGSGTLMNDLTFNGGFIGLDYNNQQYMFKGLTFNGCNTGIKIENCFDCVLQKVTFTNCGTGLDWTSGSGGSIAVIDSSAHSVGTAIAIHSETTGQASMIIENFSADSSVTNTVTAGGSRLVSGAITQTWVYGNAYTPGGPSTGSHQTGTTYQSNRPSALLDSTGKYVAVAPPTYKEYDVSQFLNVKSVPGLPVFGDGQTDDTNNLNTIISQNAGCKILFFPAGTYLVTNTIFFPPGSRVVGEAWSAISATGGNFFNPSAPTTMVRVGNAGDRGVAQFSDMLFTVADVLQGCTLLEVNMAGNTPGDVGFWNSHHRVGGAAGSKVQTNCGGSPAQCKAAFMLLHLTPSSSAYIEGMWGWTADHDLDGGNGQTISTGRGYLIEATQGTWLVGTASEHNTLYEYNINNARNVYIGMQQCETPYWQGPGNGQTLTPAPWSTTAVAPGDPVFSNCGGSDAQCRMSWYQIISGSSALHIYGSGFWTFFNENNPCNSACQTNAITVSGTSGLNWWGINTRFVSNLIINNGAVLVTQNNNPGGWGAVVGAFLTDS